MRRSICQILMAGLVLVGGHAWAIVGADIGGVWVQATWKDKLELTNIISRELGGSPDMYLNCLENMFQDPTNLNKTILQAAKECRTKNPQ